jgi:hypothetical protein
MIRPGRSELESQLGQDFSLLHSIENGCGVYQASYPVCTWVDFPKIKKQR